MADDIIYISCSDDSDSTHQRYLREMARLARNERVKRIKANALANPIPGRLPASTDAGVTTSDSTVVKASMERRESDTRPTTTNVTITRVTTSAVMTRVDARTASSFGPTSRMMARAAATPSPRTAGLFPTINLPTFARRLATSKQIAPVIAPRIAVAEASFQRFPCDLRSLFQRGKILYPPNPNQEEQDLRDRFEVAKRTWLGAAVPRDRPRGPVLSNSPAQGSPPTNDDTGRALPRIFTAATVVPAKWPNAVARLAANFNPHGISFSYHQRYGSCACASSCRMNTCRNSALGIFCNPLCCPFKGKCGNGLVESDRVQLVRLRSARHLALVAREPIEAHVVIGQYLGQLSLENARQDGRQSNEGYRLYLHHDDNLPKHKRICINALNFGGMMRYANHSCTPAARFYEVANGDERAIVVATLRRVAAGEEITVDYGSDLWFKCRCSSCHGKPFNAVLSAAKSCEDCLPAEKGKSRHAGEYAANESNDVAGCDSDGHRSGDSYPDNYSSPYDDYRKRTVSAGKAKRTVSAGKAKRTVSAGKAKRRRTDGEAKCESDDPPGDESDWSPFDDYRKRSVVAGLAKRRRTDGEAKCESDDPPGYESDWSPFDDYRKRSVVAGLAKRRHTDGEAKCESDDPPGYESDSSHFDNYRKLCAAAFKAKRRRTRGDAKCESDDPPGDESDNELVTL